MVISEQTGVNNSDKGRILVSYKERLVAEIRGRTGAYLLGFKTIAALESEGSKTNLILTYSSRKSLESTNTDIQVIRLI